MTVLNVEYLSEFECIPVFISLFLIILMLLGFSTGILLIGISKNKRNIIISGIFILLLSILLFIGMHNAAITETDYISKKYVMFEDDKMPIEEFINWEIVDYKGPIYILAPRDGKKIKDEEKSK